MANESKGRTYRLISGDGHVNESPDVWVDRVPAAMKDRAPRIEHFEEGDAWVIEGVKDPINFGMNACAGLAPEDMKGWARFEDLRKGGYDPAVRLEEMDRDGTDAEVMYPTPRLSQAIIANEDAEYQVAMVQAAKDLGVTLDYQESNNDPEAQAQFIEAGVDAGCDGIAVSAPNPDAIQGAMDKAKGAVKDAVGKVTGDKQLQAEGKLDKMKGEIHKTVGDVKDAIKK